MKLLQKVRNVRGLFFVIQKQGGCSLQIKVARDQDNIFHFELCVNKVLWLHYLAVNNFLSLFLSYFIQRRLQCLKCAMLGAFAVHTITIYVVGIEGTRIKMQ